MELGIGIALIVFAAITTWLSTRERNTVTPEMATKERPFINSLGMKFVPVPVNGGPTDGKRVLFCICQTRVKDLSAFVDATGHDATTGMFSLEVAKDGKSFA